MPGVPEQVQVNVPAVIDGLSVTVTAWPTEVVAVEPITLMTPPVLTLALAILPAAAMTHAVATVVGMTVPPPAP